MELLKKRIEEDGVVLSPSVLKVDAFLNHGIDVSLMDEIGKEFADTFKDEKITKVMTIESGGIAPAMAAAYHLDVPLIFAKKSEPSTMNHPVYAKVHSFTKNTDYTLCMERNLIEPSDRILFVDDFLANGQAFLGIQSLIEQCQASLAGAGICIEKSWQSGREILNQAQIPVCVLASIKSMSEEGIVWNEE